MRGIFLVAAIAGHIFVSLAPLAAAQAQSGDPQKGVLGPVNALGQEFKQPEAPTGPPARLPDGTIDLGDGFAVATPSLLGGLIPGDRILFTIDAGKSIITAIDVVQAAQ